VNCSCWLWLCGWVRSSVGGGGRRWLGLAGLVSGCYYGCGFIHPACLWAFVSQTRLHPTSLTPTLVCVTRSTDGDRINWARNVGECLFQTVTLL
jgi:hypothetical protein